jgi:hypothetical protein
MADELTFTATRSKAVFLVLGCLVFVVGGYFIRAEKPVIAWACMIFFGLGLPLCSVQLFWPNSSYLRLDAAGFEIGSLLGKKRVKWTDVAGFQIGSIRGAKMIQIIYSPQYQGQKVGRAVAESLGGMEGAIANNYNAPLDELLKTLNEWQTRYGTRR